jgi:hypothetical protein
MLSYNPETGEFTWRVSPNGNIRPGQVAGHIAASEGRRLIRIDGVRYCAHHLAVLWVTGEIPGNEVHHIDGDKTNNRWSNLHIGRPAKIRPQHLTQARLREVLDYDPETGIFRWRIQTSNRGRVGHIAGRISDQDYWLIGIDGALYRAHRLAWLYITGEWPREVDHINGSRDDNRWCNLREATRSENNANSRRGRNNTSGYKGVWRAASGRWTACITVNYRQIHLGRFDAPEEAHAAYCAAADKHFGEFANGGGP